MLRGGKVPVLVDGAKGILSIISITVGSGYWVG